MLKSDEAAEVGLSECSGVGGGGGCELETQTMLTIISHISGSIGIHAGHFLERTVGGNTLFI